MRWTASLTLLLLLALPACGSSDPYCSVARDETGRQIELCPGLNQEPVCDLSGDEARFEDRGGGGAVLVGGDEAICDEEGRVICPPNTVGDPFCIEVPQL